MVECGIWFLSLNCAANTNVPVFVVIPIPGPLEYPLNDFENGEIHVRLQINGVEDTVSEIYVK